MIVCQCKGTTDEAVRKAVRSGASGVGEVSFLCGAGADCGGCHETIEALIRDEREKMQEERRPGRTEEPDRIRSR
jgi:bacterioferritin-associated ferredoxin